MKAVRFIGRHGLKVLAGLILSVLVGGVLLLRTRYAWEQSCTLARKHLPELLGMDVTIGRCELDPMSRAVRIFDFAARSSPDEPPVLSAARAEVSIISINPFFNQLEVGVVRLEAPHVRLDLRKPSPQNPNEPPKTNACVLPDLKRLRVGMLDIRDAHLELLLPGEREVVLGALEVHWKARRRSLDFRVEAGEGTVKLSGPPMPLSRLSLEGALDLGEESLQISRGELGLQDLTATWSGKVETLCSPRLALDTQLFLPLPTVVRAAGAKTHAAGHVWARAALNGKPEQLKVSAEVVGNKLEISDFRPGDFTARLRLEKRELIISSFKSSTAGGQIDVSGSIKLDSPTLLTKAHVTTKDVELARVLERVTVPGAWANLLASVDGNISGSLLPMPKLQGKFTIGTQHFVLRNTRFDAPEDQGRKILEIDAGRGTTGLRILPDRVEIHDIDLRTAHSHATGEVILHYASDKGIIVRAQAETDLSDFRHIAGFDWSGKGNASVYVHGAYHDVKVEGEGAFHDFKFWNLAPGTVHAKLQYDGEDTLSFPTVTGQRGASAFKGEGALRFLPDHIHAKARFSMPDARTQDVVDLLMPLHSSFELFQGVMTGKTQLTFEGDAPVETFNGRVGLVLQDTEYFGRRLGNGRMDFRFVQGTALKLEPSTLRGPLGTLTADGTFSFEGPLDYRIRAEGLALAELVGIERAKRLGIRGDLKFVAKIDGDSTTPMVSGYLTSPSVTLGDRSLGDVHLEGRVQGRDLHVFGRLFEETHSSLKMKLREPFAYQATVGIKIPEIRPLLPRAAAQGMSGSLKGRVQAEGNLRDPSSLSGDLTLDSLTVSRDDFSGRNEGPLTFSYRAGRLEIGSFAFKGPDTELTAQGFVGPSKIDVKMLGSLDMRLLESFLPSLEHTAGRIELGANMKGTVESPLLVGSADIRNARLSVKGQPLAMRAMSGHVEFSEARVLVQGLRGILNDGRAELRCDLTLEKRSLKHMEIGIQLDEVSFRPLEDLPLVTNGELLLYGKPDALVLSGDLDISKLRYEKDFELGSLLQSVRKARLGDSSERPREWLTFDVRVRSTGDVRVDNNLAKAKLLGSVRLTGTNLQPGLLGTIEAAPGSRAYFRGNEFTVTQGLLEFRERNSVDALFDIHAETRLRDYLIRLHAFGRTTDPKVLLSSEPELSEGDILSLLTLGVTSRDRSNTAQTSAGLAAEALLNMSGLDRQLQRFLPKNAVIRDLSFHLSTTYNSSSGVVEPTAHFESKFLTDRLKLSMVQPVLGKGTRAWADYNFDNRLSFQAQWDNENVTSSSSIGNLGLDLKFRWELE